MEHEFHAELKAATAEHITKLGYHAFTEFNLSNKYIADILTIGPAQTILIFEIKTYFIPSDLEDSWLKYSPYCHGLYLVIPTAHLPCEDRTKQIFEWRNTSAATGLLAVHKRDVKMIRQAIPRKMNNTLHHRVMHEASRRLDKYMNEVTKTPPSRKPESPL